MRFVRRTAVPIIVLGLLTGQAGAYEPPGVDGAMVYLRVPFNAMRGSDRVASVGLRLGEAVGGQDATSRVYRDHYREAPTKLDFHFYRSERGGPLLNGMELTPRRDLSRFGIPLFLGTE